jgi:predicted heme/steroid binding protein
MLHKGTIITATLLIALAVWAFVIDLLAINNPIHEQASMGNASVATQAPDPETTAIERTTVEESLPTFTTEALAMYDGTDPSLPIYLAFEGKVYDVTTGKKFYGPSGPYHFLAGTDGTTMLRIAGGSIIKAKYPIVGTYIE